MPRDYTAVKIAAVAEHLRNLEDIASVAASVEHDAIEAENQQRADAAKAVVAEILEQRMDVVIAWATNGAAPA